MQKWIMSANGKYFDHEKAFNEYGHIDWKQTRNFAVGDIVFLYMTKPESRIKYKTRVDEINIANTSIDDYSLFWKKNPNEERTDRYVRLSLIEEYDIQDLDFDSLKKHGMPYAPQSPCKVNEEVEKYLMKLGVVDKNA